MTVIYYQQLWSDLQYILTNSVLNSLYCMYVVLTKCTILKLIPTYFIIASPTLIPGLNNPLAIVHPVLLLLAYLKGYKSLYKGLLLVLVMWAALFLGGWWASQEFNWGGWWNWDLIESPALIYSLVMLMHLHKFRFSNLVNLGNQLIMLVLLILILVNTRFLSNNSVHSFVSGSEVLEKFLLLITCNLLVSVLFTVNLLNLHNLLFLKFVLLYFILSTLLRYLNNHSKVKKYHRLLIILVLYQQFWQNYHSSVIFWYEGLGKFSYKTYFYRNHYMCITGINIPWYKEISFKI